VNDFGIRQFPTNYGGMSPPPMPPHPQRPPHQPSGGSSKPFLVLLLIIACVILGVLLAWGLREHGERNRLSARNHDVEDAYVFVLAKRSDLASFLTDPRTHLYRLTSRHGSAGSITIAWQEENHNGLLIGDRIPQPADNQHYAIWHVDTAGKTQHAADFRPDPAGTYAEFHIAGPASATAGFRISLEADSSAREPAGDIVYETRP
jgi:hypothetical protein